MAVFPIRSMANFRAKMRAEDFSLISGQTEHVQLKHKHKSIKKKDFHQPIEIRAIDLWVDFCLHYDQGDFEEATPLYYQLRRLSG